MLAGHIMIPLNIFKLYILNQNDIETFLHLFSTTAPKKRFLCDQRSHRLSYFPWVAFEGPKFKLPCWPSSLSEVWATGAQVSVSFSL